MGIKTKADTKSNTLLLIVGAIGVLLLGAIGMLLAIKLTTPAVPTPVVAATPAVPAVPMAQVVSVQPHYVLKSVPYRSCRQVPRTAYVQQQSSMPGAGTLLGGAAGGLLGNQVGEGRGRTAATIGGAVLGAVVGNQVQDNMNQPEARTVYVTVCNTRYTQKSVQSGYDVTYLYNGQQGATTMQNPPIVGSTVPLMSLTPAAMPASQ
jgi:uncharacterized protein YcfJ